MQNATCHHLAASLAEWTPLTQLPGANMGHLHSAQSLSMVQILESPHLSPAPFSTSPMLTPLHAPSKALELAHILLMELSGFAHGL